MTCDDCGATLAPGDQWPMPIDRIVCNDRVTCTERMIANGKAAKTGTEPVKEDASQ